jgi:hypothetical protein
MKKVLYLLATVFLFSACNQQNVSNKEAAMVHQHEATDSVLSLNNGTKWQADSITTHNVVNLKTIADNFRIKSFPSVNDYQLLGNDLTTGINQLIHYCKMSGSAHDELHKWLEPVLKESNQLKSVTDTAVGRSTFKSLDSRIDAFHQYFQ